MVGFADGTGPGGFDEAQAKAYAAATDIETEFPHDQVFLDILRHYSRGAALDLGGGMGRYAAWLLHMGLVTSAHVIDKSPSMIDECLRRGLPGLSAQVDDIETVDLGREKYDIVLARFVLMHVRDLESTLNHIVLSMKDNGTLVVVTNIVDGPSTVMTTFFGERSRIMKLILQAKGSPLPVFNYVRTQEEYTTAFQQAGLHIEFSETYEPKILHFETEHPGITLSHFVLMGKR
jgi:2-polyprenyl-3-methyl-5-hydroxy-6-metoxy-1,4-benzoquinol methylase